MPPVRTDARVEDTMWVVNDVKRDMSRTPRTPDTQIRATSRTPASRRRWPVPR